MRANRTRPTSSPSCAAVPPAACGTYLTDGRRLLRVVSQFDPRSKDALAELEDCASLAVGIYTLGELAAMDLRPVAVQPNDAD